MNESDRERSPTTTSRTCTGPIDRKAVLIRPVKRVELVRQVRCDIDGEEGALNPRTSYLPRDHVMATIRCSTDIKMPETWRAVDLAPRGRRSQHPSAPGVTPLAYGLSDAGRVVRISGRSS